MSLEAYQSARREGLRQVSYNKAHGLRPYPGVLDELEPRHTSLARQSLGIISIDPELIGGTVTAGRMNAFSYDFLPLTDADSEFAHKWMNLYDSVVAEGQKQPVTALEYYGRYYILEGNKRVSVARRLGGSVEAEVTRVIPEPEDSYRYRVYKEYVRFFDDTRFPDIRFGREGGYERLCMMAEQKPGTKWAEDDVLELSAAYARFSEVFRTEKRRMHMPVDVCTAMMMAMRLYGYRDFVDALPAQMKKMLQRIQPELTLIAAEKPAAIEEAPVKGQPGFLKSVFKMDRAPLRVGFLHNGTPARLGWTYWHEVARKQLCADMKDKLETVSCFNTDPAEAEGVIDSWIRDGIKVIFATSPLFYEACMRQAVLHPEAVLLTCSPKGLLSNVRAYYIRHFEAKFILGAIAGAMTKTDRIGYIAEYPILTTPASINAFALGALMTNPEAHVILDWSTLIDHDPEQALLVDGVDIISGHDLIPPTAKHGASGLYRPNGDSADILAIPVSRWSSLYRSVLDSIMTDSWNTDKQNDADRMTQYYAGVLSGAVDISFGSTLPTGIRRMGEMLRDQLKSSRLMVFEGPVIDSRGELRIAEGRSLTLSEIINMDYLTANVSGRFPSIEELRPEVRPMVLTSGIGSYGRPVL